MRSKKALKNITVSLVQNIVVIICGFIVPKLIITNFGSDVNGLINSITQFLAYITLLESGIGPVIKSKLYKPIAKKEKNEIENILYASLRFFRTIVKIFIIYIIILCFTYPIIVKNNFDYPFTITLLIIISFSTIAEYYFGLTYTLFLQADQKTYISSAFSIFTTIINTIVVIVLVKLNANIFLVKLLSSLFLVLKPLLLNYYVKKKYNFSYDKVDKKFEINNKWDGLAQHIAAVVHSNTDIAVLTLFSNILEVSVYSVYQLVIKGIKSLVSSLTGGIDASFGDMIVKGEKENLNKNFSTYEALYYTLITIIYTCTLILITPFISIYTKGISDVNYIRNTFAFLIVLAEYMHSIRLPYSSITLAAGHFKQTMKGAWFEAISNLVISIVLVFKFGIIGVAIGTLFAMTVRTIEFNYHSSKYILERKVKKGAIKPTIALIESLIIYFIINNIKLVEVSNYISWFIYAIIVFIISSIVVIIINHLLYKKDFSNLKAIIKRTIIRKK